MMATQNRVLKLYNPHETQVAFHSNQARYRVAAWGRQSGKSTAALNDILKRGWENPNHTIWFVSPTFDQAKKQYRRLVSMLWNCRGVMLKKNQTELRVKLVNMAQIEFKSGEVFDNLLGDTLNGVVIDECRDQRKELWTRILQPMIRTTGGWASFISTPNGFDWFYELAEAAKIDKTGKWSFMHAPSSCNPLWTPEEIQEAKDNMSEDEFAQEILAEFREMGVGKVYLSHGSWNQLSQNPFAEPGKRWSDRLPIVVGLDFNVGLMVWELAQHAGPRWHFADEVWDRNTNTQTLVEILVQRVAGHKAGVILVGDASGNARKTSSHETDYQILMRRLKDVVQVRNLTPDSNPPVRDRINIINAGLKSASGDVQITYDPVACHYLKLDLQRVTWKTTSTDSFLDKSDADRTHASDAFGYPICEQTPSWKPPVAKPYWIVR